MFENSLDVPTVEDRLISSVARLRALKDLAQIRAKHERSGWTSVEIFTLDLLHDLQAIESMHADGRYGAAPRWRALHRSVAG